MIDRRTFLAGAGAVLLAAPMAVEAQQAAKIARIGYLAGDIAGGPHLKIWPVAMASVADVEPALVAITRARPGALIVLPTPITSTNGERIGELAIRLRIPSITAAKALMERGVLMSYGADARDVERRIPGYVDRIIKGARPADMPVERPTKFELFINMTTAKAIGLTIPQSLLLRADGVI